jgi:hypothetical protein
MKAILQSPHKKNRTSSASLPQLDLVDEDFPAMPVLVSVSLWQPVIVLVLV